MSFNYNCGFFRMNPQTCGSSANRGAVGGIFGPPLVIKNPGALRPYSVWFLFVFIPCRSVVEMEKMDCRRFLIRVRSSPFRGSD